jgi:hypothetical protein
MLKTLTLIVLTSSLMLYAYDSIELDPDWCGLQDA